MRISTIGNTFGTNNVKKTDVPHKASEIISVEERKIPVRISISEEGKKKYRDSLKQSSEDFNDVVEHREKLLSKKNMPETDYSFELGNKLAALEEKDEYKSTKDKAFDLLKAYADLYDEIVQGYENGTRERYTEDQLSESGYRKLTMSEEIDSLNSAYKKYANFLEIQAQQAPKIVEAYDKYMEKISKIGAAKAELATKAQDVYSKIKEEGVLENISEKVVAASKIFVEQYAKQNLRSMSVENILENIIIFGR